MGQKLDIYQTVTNTIISALESGKSNGEWNTPWHNANAIPENAQTGNLYQGVNVPLLWAHQIKRNFSCGKWATYKQWQSLNAQVKKGEKGAQIVFWKSFEVEPENDNDEAETRMFARYSNVFNVDQVEGYEEEHEPAGEGAVIAADNLVLATGAEVRHDEEHRAYYNRKDDYINVPAPEKFRDTNGLSAAGNYYSTVFHELVHWTGADHRLNRKRHEKYGDASYAFEELIAELGAAMCCASTGLESAVRNDHTHYIDNWLHALKGDKKFIFAASSQAQKAVDYLFSFSEQTEAAA